MVVVVVLRSSPLGVALKHSLFAAMVCQSTLGCESTPPNSNVGPTIVNGREIVLPPNTLGYQRAGLLSMQTAISVGAPGTFGEFDCSLPITADVDGVHRCSLSTTLRRDTDYWIYLRDPGRAQGVDYQDEFFVGRQKVGRITQVCFPAGPCYVAGAFRIVDASGSIQ